MQMKRVLNRVSLVATIVSLSGFGVATAAAENPDATFSATSKSVAAGVGYTWGQGRLHYKGQEVKFKIKGLDLGSVGASETTVYGTVDNLNYVSDFGGEYAVAKGSAVVGMGGSAAVFKNKKGVLLGLTAIGKGLEVAAALGELTVTLEEKTIVDAVEMAVLEPVVTESLSAVANVCGCRVKMNVVWATFRTDATKRQLANMIDTFVIAANDACSEPATKAEFCGKVRQVDIAVADKADVMLVKEESTLKAGITEQAYVDVDRLVAVISE
jgi:hypothetical protein